MKATYAVQTNKPLTELERQSVKEVLHSIEVPWSWNYSQDHTMIALQLEDPKTFDFFKLWLTLHTVRNWETIDFTVASSPTISHRTKKGNAYE